MAIVAQRSAPRRSLAVIFRPTMKRRTTTVTAMDVAKRAFSHIVRERVGWVQRGANREEGGSGERQNARSAREMRVAGDADEVGRGGSKSGRAGDGEELA